MTTGEMTSFEDFERDALETMADFIRQQPEKDRKVQVAAARIKASFAYAMRQMLLAHGTFTTEDLLNLVCLACKSLLRDLAKNSPSEVRQYVIAEFFDDIGAEAGLLLMTGRGSQTLEGPEREVSAEGAGRA